VRQLDQRINTRYGEAIIDIAAYDNGAPAVRLTNAETGEPIATLSINLPEAAHQLGPDEFFAKTWTENKAVAAAALSSGLFEDTGKRIPTGFVEAQVWRFAAGALPR
jgi:hypothetical protein